MYLYPFKIFTLSKNKRLFNSEQPNRTLGIYDVVKMNYNDALDYSNSIQDAKVSVLLGKVCGDTSLICLDLDDCFLDNGELEPDTDNFLSEFKPEEYEVSTSGTGIHIYILTELELETFIVKELEGCKSFECYTNKRHIVTTTFDFNNTNLMIGAHDKFLLNLYDRVKKQKEEKQKSKFSNSEHSETYEMVKTVFDGNPIDSESAAFACGITKREPVTDMFTLRKCGYKDSALIEIIDTEPNCVDQSAHDAKLIRKLMYYTYSFDAAWELAKKTNYYKHKDERHKVKFNSEKYKERTRLFIGN